MSRKVTLEIFEAVLATSVLTTEDFSQLIFQLRIMLNCRLLLPSRVSLDDVILPKMSYNPVQKFRPYTQAWKLDFTATLMDRQCDFLCHTGPDHRIICKDIVESRV